MVTSNIGRNYPTFSLIFTFIVRRTQPTNMLKYQNSSYFLLYIYYHILGISFVLMDFWRQIDYKLNAIRLFISSFYFCSFFFRNSIFRFILHSFFSGHLTTAQFFCYRHVINKWYSFLILFLLSSNKNEIRPLEGYKIRESNT